MTYFIHILILAICIKTRKVIIETIIIIETIRYYYFLIM